MAFNTIYSGSFLENVNSDRIDIYFKQEGFTGEPSTLTLDANPVVITYPTKEFDSQIFGCGAQINILNQTGNFYQYDSLFSTPERSNYVEIIKTPASGDASIFLFQGYILPDMYSSKLGKNIQLTIPATDRLSTLDRYTPWILVDVSGYRAKEYLDGLSMVTSILYDADVTNVVKVNNTLQNINYIRDASHDTVLQNIWLQADNFQDKDKIENDKEVLEKILQSLYSRVYYFNGAWHIDRVQDLTESRTYTVYPKETSIYSELKPNNIIDLSCVEKKAIAGSAELSYNPGNSKLIVNLKYKKPESLTENFFEDFQYYTKEVSTASTLPLPKQRRWMFSTSKSYVAVPNHRPVYPYGGIEESCFLWSKQLFSGLTDEEWFDEFFSTMFLYSSKENTTSNPTSLSVKFKQGFPPTLASVLTIGASDASQNAVKFLSRFALRAVDRNGKDWWIAKSGYNDTSTYWSDTVYTFDVSTSWADIKENDYILERSEQINITDPILTDASISYYYVKVHTNEGYWFYPFIEANPKDTWVQKTYVTPTNPQYINELYLDIYDVFHNYRSGGPVHANGWYYNSFYMCWMGDTDVDCATETYPDMLEASIGYFYNTITKNLHIFDTSTVLYTNGIYNIGEEDFLRSIHNWRDKPIDDFMTLQERYMNDLSQQLAYPRYKLDIDILSNDSSILSVGYLYKHDSLKYPDDTHILFMCNGLKYNVKNNTYRLSLEEFIADDSYRLPARATSFTYDPSYLSYTWDSIALGGNDNVDVTTNMYYNIASSENWIGWTMNSSNNFTVNVSVNTGDIRDGSLWIIPDASYARPVSIHQDTSGNILLNISVTNDEAVLDLSDLPDGQSIDISIYGWCQAFAYSDAGYCTPGQQVPYSAYAEIDSCSNQIAFAQTVQLECGESSVEEDNGVKTYSDVDNTYTIGVNILGTTYYAHNEAEYGGEGYFIVSAVLHGTSTPVEFINNKCSWDPNHDPYLSHT